MDTMRLVRGGRGRRNGASWTVGLGLALLLLSVLGATNAQQTSTTAATTTTTSTSRTPAATTVPNYGCNLILCGSSIWFYVIFFLTFLCFIVPCGYLMRRRSDRLRAQRDAEEGVAGGEEGRHPLERGETRRTREEDGEPLPLYAIDDPWKAEIRDEPPPPPPLLLDDDVGESSVPAEDERVGANVAMPSYPPVEMTSYPAPSVLNTTTGSRRIVVPDAPPPAYTG
jgi:hypothetical protein